MQKTLLIWLGPTQKTNNSSSVIIIAINYWIISCVSFMIDSCVTWPVYGIVKKILIVSMFA